MNILAGTIDALTLCGNTENCLCWLIILLDIFAIFYLVFVSFYKITQFVRMLGWIWLGVLITGDIIIVAIHPCVLTLLSVLFTIMIMTAILSVVLPNAIAAEGAEQSEATCKPRRAANRGSYVVREIDSKRFCFEIYDRQNKFLVRSFNCYNGVSDAKSAISLCRESGAIANVEDRTANWIMEVNHPKFEMLKDGESFYFKLSIDSKAIMFESDRFATLKECKNQLDKTVAAVASTAVYLSVEKLTAEEAKYYNNKKASGVEKEVAVTEVEEPVAPAVEPEEKPAAEQEVLADGSIVINTAERKTLAESYADLSKEQKAFFDGLRKAAREKEGAKENEYASQLSFVMFKNNLLRMRIRRGMVEAVFMLMDDAFKRMENAGDLKIKESKTVLRIENATYYALAIETLNRKYDLLVEQKKEREDRKRVERLERLRQKRLASKNANAAK